MQLPGTRREHGATTACCNGRWRELFRGLTIIIFIIICHLRNELGENECAGL
jgi:hypothetical protein